MNDRLVKTKLFKEKLKNLKNSKYDNAASIIDIKKSYQQSTDLIDFVLKNMNPVNSWLIQNSYLNDKEGSSAYWYEEFFSKTTFYKKHKVAIKEFMEHYFDYQFHTQ